MKKGVDYPGITVSFFCHDGNGKYLLAKRSVNCRDEHGRWDCGGGGLDFGETVEGTLRKEIQEELGAEILEHEFLGFRDVHRVHKGVPTHWLSIDFKVRLDPKEVKNNEPHKFDELGWFVLGSFPEPMHSQLPFALSQYKDRL